MKSLASERLLQMVYRVAIALVFAMLVLVPVQAIALHCFLCFVFLSVSLQAECKASILSAFMTQFKLE